MSASFFLLQDEQRILLGAGEQESHAGALEGCNSFLDRNKGKFIFATMSYDLKNQIENLDSENPVTVAFPDFQLVVPEVVIEVKGGVEKLLYGTKTPEVFELLKKVSLEQNKKESPNPIQLKPRISHDEYIEKVEALKRHIQRGDIYEVTFCQEFYAHQAKIDAFATYQKLSELTNAPFRSLVHSEGKYLICGSPERFLQKRGNKLISQPIKGTAKRGVSAEQDERIKRALLSNEKERAENVMIVDLVRNDLSRIAERHSVCVDELHGLYTFNTVHQLISTVSATIDDSVSFYDIMKAAFPMGSMTGAPKISAMQLIEKYESFRRGLFSGSVGYIEPNGDFDFNVVIRSILYDESLEKISCPVGGAITMKSSSEAEYQECLLKVEAMQKALGT